MQIQAIATSLTDHETDALIVYLMQDVTDLAGAVKQVDDTLDKALSEQIDTGDFTGEAGQTTVLYTRGALPATRVIVVGLGEPDQITNDHIRQAIAHGVLRARQLNATQVATVTPAIAGLDLSITDTAQLLSEGALLALYQYHGQKSSDAPDDQPQQLDILTTDADATQRGIAVGIAFANGTSLARDLVNLPPNVCTPDYMAKQAAAMAQEVGLTVRILGKQQLQALKMGALLGVAQGSAEPPRFIILEHGADQAETRDTLVLVGKGVTFDTGGYSIKSRDGMVGMKADMSGGAAVIGAMRTIAELDVPVHVVGLVPASDNMVSDKAYRPQDVITASNGKTIEIISTDAEGRLLLADALVYAQRYQPAAVVNIATLTGSIAVALGGISAGVYSNDETIVEKLKQAGQTTQELVWHMPLYEDYGKPLESDTADTKNSGGSAGRWGGAGVAAYFLRNFVDYSWAHVDMAGMLFAGSETPYNPKHSAKGYGARLLAQFAHDWSAS